VRRNEVVIDGRLLKRSVLRYTPAGTPAVDLLIGHRSIQSEGGSRREARCEIEAVALGDIALKLSMAKLNRSLQVGGFLAQRSLGNRRLVLHVVSADAVAGDQE
jgi:primosomal replication protein N